MVNSARFDGLPAPGEAFAAIVAWLGERGLARKKVNFKLRDWLISRQRYWGVPIPIVYCDRAASCRCPSSSCRCSCPTWRTSSRPTTAARRWRATRSSCARPARAAVPTARRETDTMDTFVDSSWYHFRFPSPHYDGGPVRARRGRLLAAGRHVRRWGRARGHAPALRALLRQGAAGRRPGRLRRALRAPAQPGHGARRGQPEDEQVEGQRHHPRQRGREVRRRQPARLRALHRALRAGGGLERPRRAGLPPVPGALLEPGPRRARGVPGGGFGAGGRRRRRGAAGRRRSDGAGATVRARPRNAAAPWCAPCTRRSARSPATWRASASTPPSRR